MIRVFWCLLTHRRFWRRDEFRLSRSGRYYFVDYICDRCGLLHPSFLVPGKGIWK